MNHHDLPCNHAVAHRLGLEGRKLEKVAYKAIEAEYNCLDLWGNTKSDECFNKREIKYISAQKASDAAIELFDNFEFLYHCLLDCFQVFDAQGRLKELTKTNADFDTALQELKVLGKGHNHRRFYPEKRKGKNPNELFTGQTQTQDWLELLRQKVAI